MSDDTGRPRWRWLVETTEALTRHYGEPVEAEYSRSCRVEDECPGCGRTVRRGMPQILAETSSVLDSWHVACARKAGSTDDDSPAVAPIMQESTDGPGGHHVAAAQYRLDRRADQSDRRPSSWCWSCHGPCADGSGRCEECQ